jgi:hypothetical protein
VQEAVKRLHLSRKPAQTSTIGAWPQRRWLAPFISGAGWPPVREQLWGASLGCRLLAAWGLCGELLEVAAEVVVVAGCSASLADGLSRVRVPLGTSRGLPVRAIPTCSMCQTSRG